MKKQFTVLLSLAFLAAMGVSFAASDVAAKGKDGKIAAAEKKGGKEKITTVGKKGAKEKIAPADKNQKGGKKGGENVDTRAKKK
jgi:hypothetical protein